MNKSSIVLLKIRLLSRHYLHVNLEGYKKGLVISLLTSSVVFRKLTARLEYEAFFLTIHILRFLRVNRIMANAMNGCLVKSVLPGNNTCMYSIQKGKLKISKTEIL
jgi:hypothetical protein